MISTSSAFLSSAACAMASASSREGSPFVFGAARLVAGTATRVVFLAAKVTPFTPRQTRSIHTAYVEWTLGVLREHTQHQVHTQYDESARAIFARNYFSPQFASWV